MAAPLPANRKAVAGHDPGAQRFQGGMGRCAELQAAEGKVNDAELGGDLIGFGVGCVRCVHRLDDVS